MVRSSSHVCRCKGFFLATLKLSRSLNPQFEPDRATDKGKADAMTMRPCVDDTKRHFSVSMVFIEVLNRSLCMAVTFFVNLPCFHRQTPSPCVRAVDGRFSFVDNCGYLVSTTACAPLDKLSGCILSTEPVFHSHY
jgi:hypothetical protein